MFNTSDQLVSKFNYNGEHFYRGGTYVGKIGTNQWSGNAAHKGLVFDLEYTGKYMAWCYQKTSGASSYTTMLCFHRETVSTRNRGCIWAVIFMGSGIRSTTLNFRVFLLADTVHLLERSQSS